MANHTPGPWYIRLNPTTDETLRAFADENYQISGQPNAAPWIAETFGGLREGIAEANARLIARAPSMLALLKKALPTIKAYAEQRDQEIADIGHPAWPNPMRELTNEISAEINRARGKEAGDA